MALNFASRTTLSNQPGADFIAWDSVFVPDVPITFGTQSFLPGKTSGGLAFRLTHPADLVVRTQGSGVDQWDGDFIDQERVLFTDIEPGPIVLAFNQPVRGIGANAQANLFTNHPYAVRIRLFLADGSSKAFTRQGTMQHLGTGLAPFVGALSSDADIVRAEFHVGAVPGNGGLVALDIAINQVQIVG